MITSKRKRDGPSKLSLRSSQKQLSQTQSSSSLDSKEILSQLSRSEPIDITSNEQALNSHNRLHSSPSKQVKVKCDDLDAFDLSKGSDDVAIVDLSSSPEDVFKPSKSKRIKSAPTLGNLKTIPELKTEAITTPEIQKPIIAPVENIKQINSEKLAAKLKSFEKEPPKKFPISRHNSSETLKVAPTKLVTVEEDKLQSPVKMISSNLTPVEKELPCPVCNKPAGKNRRAHMKNCAGKNGLGTVQLLQAIELQKKQADERKDLGLPFFLQQQQKPVAKKKTPSAAENDPNIQLALALSKSIKDAEEEAYVREARLMLENKDTFDGMTESQVDATIKAAIKEPSPAKKITQTVLAPCDSGRLQVTKVAAGPKSNRPGPSTKQAPFMTASNEERLRRVTEKVAMYLLDDEGDAVVKKVEKLKPVSLAKVMDDGVEEGSDLWKLASKSPSAASKSYYVKELQEFFSPSKSNCGLMHLEPVEPKFRPPPRPRSRNSAFNPLSKPASPAKKKESALTRDWASMLNSRTMSDVLVYAREDRELRAHRLVLLVRCPSIVKELASEVNDEGTGVVEYMLLWSEYSYDVVMAALEFIYCDTTCRAMKLNDDNLNDLEALSQRYEINELEEHINLLKKLREDISADNEPEEILPASPVKQITPIKSPQPNKSQESQQSVEDDVERERTELSYLVSQMDKSTLLPHRKLTLEPETKTGTMFIPLSTDTESLHEEEEITRLSPDIFASLEEESDFCKEILADNPEEASPAKKSIHERTLTPADDWRNLDGLDYLQSSPSCLSTPRRVTICNSPVARCESPPLEMSPAVSEAPLEVVMLSSDATSISQKSLSPRAASPTTPARLPLDDSLEVFEDGDLSRLEMAALKAYEKVMTPKPKAGPLAAVMATPAGSAKITPMADLSIMESPQLQKELDKFGIKKLRRNQAKLILRHIYNELHPVVASTPLARPQQKKTVAQERKTKTQTQADPKPSTSRQPTQKIARKPSPKKKLSPAKSKVTKPHNLSMSQPEGYDSFDELLYDKKSKVASASQPAVQNLTESDTDTSDNEGYCEFEADEFLTEACSQVTETQTNIGERIEEVLKSDPGLYHRILTYEPIWLEEIKDLLKQSKIKCNPTVLLDYLDDQCITYRHEHQRPARQTQKRGWAQSQRGRKKKDY